MPDEHFLIELDPRWQEEQRLRRAARFRMGEMTFFYSAGAMGLRGEGYWWHKLVGFRPPPFPAVTKTLTLNRKVGLPFAILPIGHSVYNRVSLHNPGYYEWLLLWRPDLVVSLHGTDDEIAEMVRGLNRMDCAGIELNFSCPNVRSPGNKRIPESRHPLYLKLSHADDPHRYDLSRVREIRLNSVPVRFGGVSGKGAQKANWAFIERHRDLPVAGCSWTTRDDILRLHEYYGCTSFGIGAVMLVNRRLVTEIGEGLG